MDIRITPLGAQHDRSAFSCGVESVDAYLKRSAGQAQERRSAATFIAAAPTEPARILGFFTLVQHEFRDDEMPELIARKLKVRGLKTIPGILLAQLGALQSLQGKGFGKFLLHAALQKCVDASEIVGAVAVVTDPVDTRAAAFYRKYDFLPLEDERERLLLPIRSIIAANINNLSKR